MNVLYVLGGIAFIAFGMWDGYKEIKIFAKGKDDKFGSDIKILGADIMFIIIGVCLIAHYL
jgi:hypothetical protein